MPERRHENLDPVLEELRRLTDEFRTAYKGPCLISSLPHEPDHDYINNCHQIGEKFLSLIAPKGFMYHWRSFSPYTIGFQTRHESGGMVGYQLPWDIEAIPKEKTGPNGPFIKTQSACHYHDNKIFEKIDDPAKFDPKDPHTRYLLGLRPTVNKVALARGTQQWVGSRGKNASFITEGLKDLGMKENLLSKELQAWLKIRQDSSWNRIAGHHEVVRSRVRMAATGMVCNDTYQAFTTFTILPRLEDGNLDVIVAYRKLTPLNRARRAQQENALQQLTDITALLERDPARAIMEIMQLTDQLYVCPQDYDNPEILYEEDRRAIDRAAAENLRKGGNAFRRFIDVPDASRTNGEWQDQLKL